MVASIGFTEGAHLSRNLPNSAFNDSIDGRTINRIVKQRIKLIGFDSEGFGAHSLRAGFITEAARQGSTLGDAMELSGHRDAKVAGNYYRQAKILVNTASQLLK